MGSGCSSNTTDHRGLAAALSNSLNRLGNHAGVGSGKNWYPEHAVPPGQPPPPIQKSDCKGNHKALLIGINYPGTEAALQGCINDVKNVRGFITQNYGFPDDAQHMMVLTDDTRDRNKRPTKANILKGLAWLVEGAKAGDSLFLHYSGHGSQTFDASGEEDDGMDETLVPLDYKTAGQITDDEMNLILVRHLPVGCRLTCFFDCCHSGSMLDLPYTYQLDGEEIKKINNAKAFAAAGGKRQLRPPKGSRDLAAANNEPSEKKFTYGDVWMISGCKDNQTSADATIAGKASGALSWGIIQTLKEDPDKPMNEFLFNVRKLLREGKYSQIPQMSTGHKVDMTGKFYM